jgi:predicted TIM-barrel fold metal-dependent hydrolase
MSTTPRAADCHAHVFGDKAKYPFSPKTHYQPDPSQQGTAEKFRAVLDAHGFTHGLLVGAAPYLYDNSCMLDAIASSGGRFKGIGLVKPDITDRELASLNDRGMVGMRINLMSFGMRELTEPGADRLFARIREMNWFVQIHCEKDNLVAAAPFLCKAGVRIMVDHFARPDIKAGVGNPGFQTLLELGKSGNAVVKLSGPFRSSLQGYPYTDVDPFIAAAIDAFTLDNCVWGSDWPFVRMDERMDYGPPATCLARWLPDPKDRQKVLWDTPSRLFGFN